MSLIICPQAGFGNRIRTICGALVLANLSSRKLSHVWIPQPYFEIETSHVIQMKTSYLEDFFCVQGCDRIGNATPEVCYTEWLPGDGWYNTQSFGQRLLNPSKLLKYESSSDILLDKSACILLETSYVKKFSGLSDSAWEEVLKNTYHKYFSVAPAYLEFLSDFERVQACVHIRRNDQLQLYTGFDIDLQAMQEYIVSLPEKNICILGDDKEYIAAIRQATGYTQHISRELTPVQATVVDFLIMATKCDKIYGTKFSSYSKEASLFRDTPYEEISAVGE